MGPALGELECLIMLMNGALNDVLRLSRGMTFAAGLNIGGGKAVIMRCENAKPELMRKLVNLYIH
jgi:glutamate dehydrogenase/leucine dehydrogenase